MDNRHYVKTDFIDWAQSNFQLMENRLNGSAALPFHSERRKALNAFAEMGLPTTKHEEWKYTNVAPAFQHAYSIQEPESTISLAALKPFLYPDFADQVIVLVNGRFAGHLSTFNAGKLAIVESLGQAVQQRHDLVAKHLGRYAETKDQPFVALNTAFAFDGLFLSIPKNTTIEKPIHLLHLTTEDSEPRFMAPRHLIVLGTNSKVQIVETHQSLADATYLNNIVSEIVVEANADLTHVKIQQESVKAYHFAMTQVHQARDSRYTSFNIDLGAAISRNNLHTLLDGENTFASLNGFFFCRGKQLTDNHTLIDHAKANCESHELYKGILDDQSRGVFNGKVMVRQNAQKTNAFQENKCLLLTNDAIMNAKPQLEIFADDVKCSHGATVGHLSDDALFYLRSRGINERTAQSLLRYAFASDVFERIEIDSVRERLEGILFEHFVE